METLEDLPVCLKSIKALKRTGDHRRSRHVKASQRQMDDFVCEHEFLWETAYVAPQDILSQTPAGEKCQQGEDRVWVPVWVPVSRTACVEKRAREEENRVKRGQIAEGLVDTNAVIDKFFELKEGEKVVTGDNMARSAEEFVLDESKIAGLNQPVNDDVLVIDRNLKGLDYQLAKCCSPIYGDSVFGFVTVNGGIKIHRTDCPNAPELRRRFGYRIVKAKWSGKGSSQYGITLRVIGNDDIGIVNNLTSIISKDEKLILRSINIDSHDGLFSGNLEVMINDTTRLEALIKKLRTVKGVKQVERI